jgi:hypothetical protein
MKRLLALIALVVAVLGPSSGIALADTTPTYQDGYAPADAGGGLVSDDGLIAVSVPPFASGAGDAILVRYFSNLLNNIQNTVPGPPADTIWVNAPFDLEVWDETISRLTQTDKPLTLRINYNPSDLGGRGESTLRIVRLYDQWSPFPSTVDTTNHFVTTQITVGGDYGLIASNAGAPAPAAPAPAAPAPAPAPTPAPAQAAPAPAPAPATATSSVVSGQLFFDKNGNGVMDDDDFPVGGAGVLITSGSWFSFTRTGPDGHYSFSGLGKGSYQVNVIVGNEWANTTPFAVTGIEVTGQQGSNGTANFGMWYRLP